MGALSSIADAFTEAAKAFTAWQRNVALRSIAENARELYESRTEVYNLEDSGAPEPRRQLARIRLSFLEDYQKRLDALAGTAPAPVDAPSVVPANPGAGNPKP